jgi:hypothetical protein
MARPTAVVRTAARVMRFMLEVSLLLVIRLDRPKWINMGKFDDCPGKVTPGVTADSGGRPPTDVPAAGRLY